MSTIIHYNGVDFRGVHTTDFMQTPEYEDSGTDIVRQKVQFTFEAILNLEGAPDAAAGGSVDAARTTGGAVAGITVQAKHETLRRALSHDRGNLSFSVDGTTILESTSATDAKNGPKVVDYSIKEFLPGIFRLRVTLATWLNFCQSAGGDVGPVVSNRWSFSDAIDSDRYLTRSWDGTLVVSNAGSFDPQSFRHLVVPPLQDGFKRQDMRFVTSADGLQLRYVVTDKRVHASPPTPATNWSISHTEEVGIGGEVGITRFRINLTGPPEVNRRDLLALAAKIYTLKRDSWRGTKVCMGFDVTDTFGTHEARVELTARFQRVPGSQTGDSYLDVLESSEIGTNPGIPGWDSNVCTTPHFYDKNGLAGAWANYLQSPCNPQHSITGRTDVSPISGSDPGRASGARYFLADQNDLPSANDQALYSADQAYGEAIYTYYSISNEYQIDEGVLPLPAASDSGDVQFTKIHGGMAYRILRVRAERMENVPELPLTDDGGVLSDPNGIKEVLLKVEPVMHSPRLAADGRQLIYQAEAKITYGLSRKPTINDRLRVPTTPITSAGATSALPFQLGGLT